MPILAFQVIALLCYDVALLAGDVLFLMWLSKAKRSGGDS
jgi:hypothetical protein